MLHSLVHTILKLKELKDALLIRANYLCHMFFDRQEPKNDKKENKYKIKKDILEIFMVLNG